MFPFKRSSNQRGGGAITPFRGERYQKGNGIFGTLLRKAIFPLLRYIGVKGVTKIGEFAQEAVQNPDKIKEIAKRKMKETAEEAIDAGSKRVKHFVQTGEGIPPPSLNSLKPREKKKGKPVKKAAPKAGKPVTRVGAHKGRPRSRSKLLASKLSRL